MREIESQEMFVFLSIRPNNNIIPHSFKKKQKKHLSSKDKSKKNEYEPADAVRQVRVIGP